MRPLRQARVAGADRPGRAAARACSATSGRTCATPRACCAKQPGFTAAADPDARARHRRQHRDLQPRQRDAAASGCRSRIRDRLVYVLPRHRADVLLLPAVRDAARPATGPSTAWPPGAASPPASTPGDAAELVTGVIVTGNFFDVLGVPPARGPPAVGRATTSRPGAHPVAVISLRLLADALRRPARHRRARRPAERACLHHRRRRAGRLPGPAARRRRGTLRADDDAGDHAAAAGGLFRRAESGPAEERRQQLAVRRRPAEGRRHGRPPAHRARRRCSPTSTARG